MNYSITITNASFDLTLQTTNPNTIKAAMELADKAVTPDSGYAKGTLADVFSKEAEKSADPEEKIQAEMLQKTNPAAAPDPDVHVDPPPPAKAAKATPAKKTAKPAAAPAKTLDTVDGATLLKNNPPAKEDPIEPVLIPSPPENLKALQDETAALTMEAIGRNRPAVIALMEEFGATKFSDIKVDPDKLKGFRARIESVK
jgi:hypothetical protein